MSRFWLADQHVIGDQQIDLEIEIWMLMTKAIKKFRRFFLYI